MEERRNYRRTPAAFAARVICADTGRTLGRLLDISLNGIMIVGEIPLTEDEELRLQIELTPEEAANEVVEVSATVRWSETDLNPNHFVSGLEFMLKTQSEADRVARLFWAQSVAIRAQISH